MNLLNKFNCSLLFMAILFILGCPGNVKEEEALISYTFTAEKDISSVEEIIIWRLKSCRYAHAEFYVTEPQKDKRLIMVKGSRGVDFKIAELMSQAPNVTQVEVFYVESGEEYAFPVKHWVTNDYKLCIAFSLDESINFTESLKESYQLTSDKAFDDLVLRAETMFSGCLGPAKFGHIDNISDPDMSEITVLSFYMIHTDLVGLAIHGSGISPYQRIELRNNQDEGETTITVWYNKGLVSSRRGAAVRHWFTAGSGNCGATGSF